MSDKTPSAPQTEPLLEAELTRDEQSVLHQGLTDLPTPPVRANFNQGLLTTLTSGRDFAPWWRQALTRVGWMLLPAILGCVVGVGLIHAWMPSRFRQMPIISYDALHTRMAPNVEAPGLLPMPSHTLPASEATIPKAWLPKDAASPASGAVMGMAGPTSTMSAGATPTAPAPTTPSAAGKQERK